MRSTQTLSRIALFLPLAVIAARAEQPGPAVEVHVVRIETGSSWGLSGGNSMTVDSKTIRSVAFLPPNVRPLANGRASISTRASISPKEWQHLLQSIDVKALQALPSPIECLSCVDAAETDVVLEFSDGTTKRIDYDPRNPPPPVKKLLQELNALFTNHHLVH